MFNFSLQVPLNIREIKEKQCLKEVALQYKEVEQINFNIEILQNKLKRAEKELSLQSKENRLHIPSLQSINAFRERINKEVRHLNQKKEKERKILKEKQIKQIKATQDKKMLEIVKEKEKEKYQKAQKILENKIMNEVAINQFIQRKK